MEEKLITLETRYTLQYDEDSEEFKEALESFNELIQSNSNVNDMMKHVAFNLSRSDAGQMIEGVGYVRPSHLKWKHVKKPHSGISVLDDETEVIDCL